MKKMCFGKADVLLPDFIGDAAACRKWAVIACDQFTGEPAYWHEVERIVGDAPSTLKMILPEAYLGGDNTARLGSIAETMRDYRKNLLRPYPDALIYVRRTQSDGKVRRGIVGAVDLECYDYAARSTSPVRATEGTVLERIPPRVAVRRAASLEAPHVMLLLDDPKDTVIKKFKSAVTDSGSGICRAEGKEGIGNLMTIYSAFTGKSDEEIAAEFEGRGYGDFKLAVGETVADVLAPVRERFAALMQDRAYLDACCAEGLEQAMRISQRTRDKVYKKIGFFL
mgnify:CR=1 FL=1